MSYIPQQSYKAMSNSVSSSFQFLSFLLFSSTSTSPSAIVLCLPLLRNIFNEQHWNLVDIVFMVAKLGNLCFESNICDPGSEKVFDFRQKKIFVSEQQNFFPQHIFLARLNWETFWEMFCGTGKSVLSAEIDLTCGVKRKNNVVKRKLRQ